MLILIVAVFPGCYLPVGSARFDNAILEAFHLVKWYAQEHVPLCLIPAFFIAGAIGVFISQSSMMRYLGPKANKILAYGVASSWSFAKQILPLLLFGVLVAGGCWAGSGYGQTHLRLQERNNTRFSWQR